MNCDTKSKVKGTPVVSAGLLVITNYNQISEVADFLQRAERHFPKRQSIFVDDASTDGSDQIARKCGYNVVRHSHNMGTGAAIRTGLLYGIEHGYKWVVLSSSNGKIKPEEYEVVYGPVLRGEADYVTGSRFLAGCRSPGLTPFRRLSIPIFSAISALILGRRYSDITCGFRSYLLEVIQDPAMNVEQEWLNRYELEYYIHYYVTKNKKWRIKEVPVTIEYSHLQPGRKSKIKPFSGWWSMIRPFVFLRLGLKR